MTLIQSVSMSDTEVRHAIDVALNKVAKQLRELNHTVRPHSA
jgi:hypothetical protein